MIIKRIGWNKKKMETPAELSRNVYVQVYVHVIMTRVRSVSVYKSICFGIRLCTDVSIHLCHVAGD